MGGTELVVAGLILGAGASAAQTVQSRKAVQQETEAQIAALEAETGLINQQLLLEETQSSLDILNITKDLERIESARIAQAASGAAFAFGGSQIAISSADFEEAQTQIRLLEAQSGLTQASLLSAGAQAFSQQESLLDALPTRRRAATFSGVSQIGSSLITAGSGLATIDRLKKFSK